MSFKYGPVSDDSTVQRLAIMSCYSFMLSKTDWHSLVFSDFVSKIQVLTLPGSVGVLECWSVVENPSLDTPRECWSVGVLECCRKSKS